MIRAFDEQEELSSTTEEDIAEECATGKLTDPGQYPPPVSAGTPGPARNFSKLPLDNSTSFSEYDAHLLETSMISVDSKSSFVEEMRDEENKSNLNNINCDQGET